MGNFMKKLILSDLEEILREKKKWSKLEEFFEDFTKKFRLTNSEVIAMGGIKALCFSCSHNDTESIDKALEMFDIYLDRF